MSDIEVKKIIEKSNRNEVYLIEKITDNIGFFAYDKHFVFLESNYNNNSSSNIKTEYLSLYINIQISSESVNNSFNDGNYNVIVYEGIYNDENFESFVSLCKIYANNSECLSFKDFFNSLVSLFQLPKEQKLLNGIGLYGELRLIQFVKDKYDVDLTKFWHCGGTFSKYDFNSENFKIECKTTIGDKNIVTIKHDQLFNPDKCVLAKISCDFNDNGESIENIQQKLLSKNYFFNNLKFSISLMKEIKRISIDNYKNMKLTLNKIDFYFSDAINPFDSIPDNVHNMIYQLDVSKYVAIDENNLGEIFKKGTSCMPFHNY